MLDKIVMVSPEPAYLGRRPLSDTLPEEWRPTVGFPGYEVSSLGRVVSYRRRRPHILSQHPTVDGYRWVSLVVDGRHRSVPVYVHRLVLEAFHERRPRGLEARHLDGNPSHNVPSNLAWGTRVEQMADMDRHGTSRRSWTRCSRNHPFDEANTLVRRNGRRMCRKCHRLREKRRRDAIHRSTDQQLIPV